MNQPVYADFAAATPTDSRVVQAMEPFHQHNFGNPSSVHSFGATASKAVVAAQSHIATFLGCQPSEVFFTSTGTESNNLALSGVAKANRNRGKHIITSAIEHPSVLNTCRALEKDGFEVTFLPVGKSGLIDLNVLEKAVRTDTILVSIHLANSEIGVVQSMAKISQLVREKSSSCYVHTDACQAATFIDLDVDELGVDLLTFNGSKMYGPKGVACLYIREGVNIFPIVYGGGQQLSLRSGTENVPGIVGLAVACQLVTSDRQEDGQRILRLRDALQRELGQIPGVSINVNQALRLPNHLSITVNQSSETDIVAAMDEQGVAVSAGSACSSKSLVESHVLQALGLSPEEINKTMRITLGRQTTEKDCQKIIESVKSLSR